MSTTNATNATVPSPTTCWSPQSPYPAEEPEAAKAPVVNARRDEGAGPAVSIFCDLDGVLADFDAGVRQLTGSSPEDMPVSQMWRAISGSRARNGFFGSLDWMSDGEELWDAIAPCNPTILTGIPTGGSDAVKQKKGWCWRRLGAEVPVVCCASSAKRQYASRDPSHVTILIDDRTSNGRQWEVAGGLFVHHKSTATTLATLHRLNREHGLNLPLNISKATAAAAAENLETEPSTPWQRQQQRGKKGKTGQAAAAEMVNEAKAPRRRPNGLPKLIILGGLPGSGKSTFATLLTTHGIGFQRLSQDAMGSRRKVEDALGQKMKQAQRKGETVILDRCNVEAEDRRKWLDLAMVNKGEAVAVFFDTTAEECIRRIVSRTGHETIRGGDFNRAKKIVYSWVKKVQVPVCSEGFKEVFVVRTSEEARRLLAKFGVPLSALATELN